MTDLGLVFLSFKLDIGHQISAIVFMYGNSGHSELALTTSGAYALIILANST